MKRSCYVHQPLGIGDILYIQKLVKHYADSGYRVVCPILDKFEWMQPTLAYPGVSYPLIRGRAVQPFEHCQEFFALAKRADEDIENPVFRHPVDTPHFLFLPLGPSHHRFGAHRVMPAKYEMCGLDYADWADYVTLARNPEREHRLYAALGLREGTRYTLVNEHCSAGRLPMQVPGRCVRMETVEGFGLLDWLLVAERAARIVTIDTSVVLLVEILRLRQPLYMISRFRPPHFDGTKEILRLPWNYVPTPADLALESIE
jgi:hypothetical protein